MNRRQFVPAKRRQVVGMRTSVHARCVPATYVARPVLCPVLGLPVPPPDHADAPAQPFPTRSSGGGGGGSAAQEQQAIALLYCVGGLFVE